MTQYAGYYPVFGVSKYCNKRARVEVKGVRRGTNPIRHGGSSENSYNVGSRQASVIQ